MLAVLGLDKYREFGPVVRETVLPGTDIVWLFDPKDIRDCAGISLTSPQCVHEEMVLSLSYILPSI